MATRLPNIDLFNPQPNIKPTKDRNMSTTKKKTPANIVWFEIPADNLERAKTFYGKLFGWKIGAIPGMPDYLHIDTSGPDASPDGGMMNRKHPKQTVTNYVGVPSVTQAAAKVKKLGGEICMPKTAVPGMGYFVVCTDTEGNQFALWEHSKKAK
jgi:predicted enzyme related to lactoylglutathione lyase